MADKKNPSSLNKQKIAMNFFQIISILFVLSACQNSQKSNNNSWEKLIDPKDTIREYFDVAFFDSVTNVVHCIDYENGKITYCQNFYKYYTNEWDLIQRQRADFGFKEWREHSDSSYYLYFEFYKNGNIKSKNKLYAKERFLIENTYEYDSIGNLINVIDNDAFYIYSIDSILLYIKNNNIPIRSIGRGKFKDINNNKPTWILNWIKYNRKIPDTDSLHYLYLDGITGQTIRQDTQHYEKM